MASRKDHRSGGARARSLIGLKSSIENKIVKFHPFSLLLLLLTLFASAGSSCPYMMRGYPEPPTVLQPSPTLQQIMLAVNTNSERVLSIDSHATLSGTGFPSLRANVAFDRPRRIRMRAETALTGPEVDLGSNDDLFWFWVKRSQPQALYFCRHDQLAVSSFRQIMPLEPEWLIEAMGVTTFDPSLKHEGPQPVHGGRLQIVSPRITAAGNFKKITIVDEKTAVVLEQHLYDARGTRIASALTSRHRFVPLGGAGMPQVGASMPQEVDIEWPANQVHLRLDFSDFQLNTLHNVPSPLWAKPEYPGYANVDLARPSGLAGPVMPTAITPPAPVAPQMDSPIGTTPVLPATANVPIAPENVASKAYLSPVEK